MMKYPLLLIAILGNHSIFSQNFGLEHDTIFSAKPVDFFTFYLPNDFYNNTGQNLQLRWVKEAVVENYNVGGHGGQNNAGLWDYSIQDHPTVHLSSKGYYIIFVMWLSDQVNNCRNHQKNNSVPSIYLNHKKIRNRLLLLGHPHIF